MSEMLPEIFDAAGEQTSKAMQDGGGALAKVIEDAAGQEEQCVGNELSADAQAVKAATAIGEKAGQDAGDVPSAEGPAAGSAAAAAAANPEAAGRDLGSLPTAGDPVDVATGDVVLGQADVRLPGALPLVVERAHRSGCRAGRWFGRSWFSTLDQRLEVTPAGVFFAAADGSVLSYPRPERDGELVWPASGARWPLASDGDAYTVSDLQAGTAARFEPRSGYHLSAGGYGELPLVSVTSRAGHQVAVGYGPDGVPQAVTHDGGYQVTVEVAGGRVARLALAGAGREGQDVVLVRYAYDEAGNLAEVTGSSAAPQRFSYDPAGRLTGWQDRNGWRYRYAYDEAGRCVRGDGPDAALSGTFAYDPASRMTTHTDSAGAVTVYQLTAGCRVAAVTDPLGHTTRSEYDRHGQLVSRTDPLGRTTRWSYDQAGNLTTLTRPDGAQATARYSELNLPVTVTAPGGTTWQQEFDRRGNVVRQAGPDGSVTACTYDERGSLAAFTDPLGAVTLVDCNPAGLPVCVTTPDGAVTRYGRDGFGRVTAVIAPDGLMTRLAWTVEGQLASRAFSDGTTEQLTYDGEGNLVAFLDRAGSVTRFEYGCFDRLVSRISADGTRSALRYDQAMRLTSVIHGGLTWRYDYDPAGWLTAQTDCNGAVTRYTRDPAGQVTERVNAAGQHVSYAYDLLGNVISRDADGGVTAFGYHIAGWLIQAASAEAVIKLERDACGRVTAETCNGRGVLSQYDAAGRRVRRVTPASAETWWAFDAAGRPVALSSAGQELRFGYDRAGRETTRELPGGACLAQEWDTAGRMAAQTLIAPPRVPDPSSPPASADLLLAMSSADPGADRLLQRRGYSYRADGFLARIDDLLSGPRRLTLDRAGQVTGVAGPGWSEGYNYDPAGNITTAAWPELLPQSVTPVTPVTQLLAGGGGLADGAPAGPGAQGPREYSGTLLARAGDIRYQHDQAGRVILRQRARLSREPDTWRYEWDADDRLTAATTPDGTRWEYAYDPFGRRIAKQRLGPDGQVAGHTSFTWDGPVLAEQVTAGQAVDGHPVDGQVTAAQVMDGGDGLVPRKVTTWNYRPGTFTPLTQAERWLRASQDQVDQEFYAIVTDQIGTPAELVSADGDLAGHQQQTLWGAGYWRGAQTPLRFPGQYHDDETGLHYNHHRYYDPATGRYLSPDPLGLAPTPNPHAYVPNPTRLADPLGLMGCENGDGADLPKYGPFYRSSGPSQTVEDFQKVAESGELWGRSPRNIYGSGLTPRVKAFVGSMRDTERAGGFEFYTDVEPDLRHSPPGEAWWYGDADGVRAFSKDEQEWAAIPVTITKIAGG